MNFTPNTQDQLKQLNIIENQIYTIEYLDKDYFNGDETLVKTTAKAIINDNTYSFIIVDDYGMDKFIQNARVIL
mgnify:CR=1 FL=1